MKRIEAIVRPFQVEAVKNALTEIGVTGMTVLEGKGFGRQKGHMEAYRGAEYDIEFVPKAKIEVAVPSEAAPAVIEGILTAARTGNIGDGKIFVFDIEEAVRIRTGDRGRDAL